MLSDNIDLEYNPPFEPAHTLVVINEFNLFGMAKKDQVLDMSPLGMIFTVVKSKADTNGKSLDLHWELLPQCNMVDPLFHIHPEAIETYHVLEGEMEFFVKDKWIKAVKGDKLAVEKGVKHTFRNPSDKVVKVYNTHEPALNMEDYFEDVCRVIDRVTNNRTKEVRMKSLKTILLLGVLMNNYRREIIAVNPPDFLVRNMGRLARIMGMDYK
jgi:mannose-6-phosphate isomerase-like protein (cupin superfamily)